MEMSIHDLSDQEGDIVSERSDCQHIHHEYVFISFCEQYIHRGAVGIDVVTIRDRRRSKKVVHSIIIVNEYMSSSSGAQFFCNLMKDIYVS